MDIVNQLSIDAVITWVDGNDPIHQSKIARILDEKEKKNIPGADKTRFGNVDELKYCLLSILTFAPFVRKIYVVTDNQDPKIEEKIHPYFPNRLKDIIIVNHQEIFEDYEEYLPVFNSRSIESMVWRIKGLSDKFIYFNDDIFLLRPVQPEDWFKGEIPIIRGAWLPTAAPRLLWDKIRVSFQKKWLGNKSYEPRASYHIGQWNAAKLLKFRFRYFALEHTAHAMNKKTAQNFFQNNEAIILKNISYKFRNYNQFNFFSLMAHLKLMKDKSKIAPPLLAYLQPFGKSERYIEKKFNLCESDPTLLYMCVQSMDLCPEDLNAKIFGWLKKKMSLK